MKRILLITLVGLLMVSAQAFALEVTALVPTRGAPGTLVAVYGGPFTAQTRLFLGEHYVSPRVVLKNQIEFTIPEFAPGSYALTVQDDFVSVAEGYQFEILSAAPEISHLEPRILDACRPDEQGPVQVIGQNFQSGALLLVNQNVVPAQVVSPLLIKADLPELEQAGVYGVAVRNPDGLTSLPHSLWIKDIPEIHTVERGEDQVNHYEVIIRGRNFHFNSTLVISEPEDSTIGRIHQQFSFASRDNIPGRDIFMQEITRLNYVDCQTLIYHRYPTSFQDRELSLQIFNPDGRKTEPYSVSLP